MRVPFKDDWVALRAALERASGRTDGDSIFARTPFGKFTGGHWTGYPLLVLLVTIVFMLLIIPTPDGWLFFGAPVVAGPLVAMWMWRNRRRELRQHVTASALGQTSFGGAEQKASDSFGTERRQFTADWAPQDGHVRVFGGQMSGHPIGLLVVAIAAFAAIEMREVRVFFALSLALGAVIGLTLWLKHR